MTAKSDDGTGISDRDLSFFTCEGAAKSNDFVKPSMLPVTAADARSDTNAAISRILIHETPPKRGVRCRLIVGEPPRRLFILGFPSTRRRSSPLQEMRYAPTLSIASTALVFYRGCSLAVFP